MRVHHLDCGTMCPLGGRLLDGTSRGIAGRLVCHCLLVETGRGLVLVDTGLGTEDVRRPWPRLSALYVNLLRIQLDPERTAVRQVRRLGFDPADVRHVVLTHLDFDHAGGLGDFPNAEVHVTTAELCAAHARAGFVGRRRYRPRQWDAVRRWHQYGLASGERWFGFDCVRNLKGLPPEILLVPLAGHTWGHAGVAVQGDGGWLLHAGDAYFYRDEIGAPERRCTPGLAAYQTLMEVDRGLRLRNQDRLRQLSLDAGARVTIFCGHDRVELEALRAGRPIPRHAGRRTPAAPEVPVLRNVAARREAGLRGAERASVPGS